ncbi:MAG: hypothetical protein VW082_02570, partial [Candidatus Nanopelagicales bacterium]
AAPANAKLDKKKSATIISFKKDLLAGLSAAGISITASNGATFSKNVLRFPVSGVGDGYVAHSGCVTFSNSATSLEVCDPMIGYPTDVPSKTWDLSVTYAGNPGLPLMTLQHVKANENCSVKKDKKTKKFMKKTNTNIQSDVHLTTNETVLSVLNGTFGPVFTADMGLGQSRTTLVDQYNSKKKQKC